MIYLGFENQDKPDIVNQYKQGRNIEHCIVIHPEKLPMADFICTEVVEYQEVIMYRTFYRLLQEINGNTLIVLDECLRTQNRYDLNYNCIRHYLKQTSHQIIFQRLPLIDEPVDFMILFDFDTQTRWKGSKFDINLILDNSQVVLNPLSVVFTRIDVSTLISTKRLYEKQREKRFREIGARDPHTIPRNLYQIGGKDKLAYINSQNLPLFGLSGNRWYIARNKRLPVDNVTTYQDFDVSNKPFCLVEFPHRFIDFSDFVTATSQYQFDVLVADLKVDEWYWNRYQEWSKRANETIASLSQR